MKLIQISTLALAALSMSHSVLAQDADVPAEMQCLRYLQGHERNLHIPQGLLTAISFAESGRPGADGRLVAWPWSINVNGQGQYFETKEEAVAATRKLLDEGSRSIDIGCMQINLRYHPNAFTTIEEAFDPATNVAYGAKFLASLHSLQGSWTKAIERYHSSDDGRREQYRERVLALWNGEARNIVMNAVLAENTDTPYHRAVRDFAAGRYADALDKYQAIVDTNPKDRIGLLGLAMSYEELSRDTEAMQTYAKYLATQPDNPSVLSKVIDAARAKAPDEARATLESFVNAGIMQSDVYAALAEITVMAGDNEAAFTYASQAAQAAPQTAAYSLNAAVIADRLNRPAAAVGYYEQFLDLFERQPVFVDTSVDGVRERVRFLRTKL